MSVVGWFLAEAAFPVSLVAGFAVAVDVAAHPRRVVRHYRWRNKRFLQHQVPLIELRNRAGHGGSGGQAGRSIPRRLAATAGGRARPDSAALPPAPSTSQRTPTFSQPGSSRPLVGAVSPSPAPTRPQRVVVHG